MEIGRLCGAWAALEAVTEQTLWGILDADQRLGPLITGRLDMRARWELILEHAPKKHDAKEIEELRGINKDLTPVTRDRNIIVHGMVHAQIEIANKPEPGTIVDIQEHQVVRPPCWTVFRGAQAGKNFPISKRAVEIVRENIRSLELRTSEFNKRHRYHLETLPEKDIVAGRPTPL